MEKKLVFSADKWFDNAIDRKSDMIERSINSGWPFLMDGVEQNEMQNQGYGCADEWCIEVPNE